MAHIFDVMSTITGQINILSEYYSSPGKSTIRKCPTVPKFVTYSIDRYLKRHQEIVNDKNKPVNVEPCILSDTGDPFNPVYIAVVSNITVPIVDKVSIHVDHKDHSGPGICILLGIPKYSFDPDLDVVASSELLREIYFNILALDPVMDYKPSIKILKVADDPRIDINTYNIQMICVALCCMNIVMKKWFGSNTKGIEEYTLSSFEESELPNEIRMKVIEILSKFGTGIGLVRESIENGTMLEMITKD